jgi:hypothetical protein
MAGKAGTMINALPLSRGSRGGQAEYGDWIYNPCVRLQNVLPYTLYSQYYTETSPSAVRAVYL